MKKIKYLFVLCIVAILTSGCVKFNAVMDIKKDKSMEFSIIYAFDKSMSGMTSMKEEDFDEVKKQGYTVTKYSDDQYEGFKITRSIKNIDEVSTESDVEYNLSGMMEADENNKYIFKVVKGADKNTYTAKLKFDSNDSSLSSDTTDLEDDEEQDLPDEENDVTSSNSLDNFDLSGMTSSMDLSFKVNLPKAAISSNATSKENGDKSLTWKLTASGKQNIEFTFELDNNPGSGNMMLYIGIGAAVVVVVAVVVVLLTKKKKETPSTPVNNQ